MLHSNMNKTIRAKQRLGKYRIERKLGDGGFAAVYQALDTLEGVRVALKIPHDHLVTDDVLADFRQEARLAARLKHPNILPLKNAEFIDGHLVLAFPLAERTLSERMQNRIALATALDFAEQMLAAVAYAHEHRVIHCDIKPDNLLLFPDGELMLTDFGIAKVALRTVRASGSGTVGYVALEQAMGKPSFRSDVFSLGLILYRMLAGQLPEWPFDWPPPGFERMRNRLHPDLIELMRRAISVDPRKRFRDAGQMLSTLGRIKPRAIQYRTKNATPPKTDRSQPDWRAMQRRQFQRQYGKILDTKYSCINCDGPVSESMAFCPWCASPRTVHPDGTSFPQCCPRCHRGLKTDWRYCPWCFGPGFEVSANRQYSDARYVAKCTNAKCSRKQLMPFMRYCPWCRRKVVRKWTAPQIKERCGSCGWSVVGEYWSHCAWCGKPVGSKRKW